MYSKPRTVNVTVRFLLYRQLLSAPISACGERRGEPYNAAGCSEHTTHHNESQDLMIFMMTIHVGARQHWPCFVSERSNGLTKSK